MFPWVKFQGVSQFKGYRVFGCKYKLGQFFVVSCPVSDTIYDHLISPDLRFFPCWYFRDLVSSNHHSMADISMRVSGVIFSGLSSCSKLNLFSFLWARYVWCDDAFSLVDCCPGQNLILESKQPNAYAHWTWCCFSYFVITNLFISRWSVYTITSSPLGVPSISAIPWMIP